MFITLETAGTEFLGIELFTDEHQAIEYFARCVSENDAEVTNDGDVYIGFRGDDGGVDDYQIMLFEKEPRV